MPIFIKKSQKSQAMPGSSVSDSKLKQMAVILHEQIKQMTATIKLLRRENRTLEHKLSQRESELRQLTQEVQRLKRTQKKNVGNVEFGD